MMLLRSTLLALVLLALAGCSINPVTGQRGLNFYGEDWEMEVGQQQYAPLRQAQGGDFVLEPAVTEYVRAVGERIAAHSDRQLPYEFNVINSSVPNAWALPAGKIVVNRGLLTELGSEAELAAVLGHEIVHSAASHSAQAASRAALTQGAVVLGAIAVGMGSDNSDYTQIALLGGMLGAQLVQMRHSRGAESEADYYGMRYMKKAGYDPVAAVELQETFVRLSGDRQSSWLDGLFSSHPPSTERVQANARTADELGRGGEMGRSEYQRQVAVLHRLKPAYDAHDEGRRALSEGRLQEAARKADEALRISNREAIFHALRGDILIAQRDYSGAEAAFGQAIALDSGWFYHHLRRGAIREQLRNYGGAREDLATSIGLLPTADGFLYLGNVERLSGNRSKAVEYYRVAAQSDSQAGEQARKYLGEMGEPVGN